MKHLFILFTLALFVSCSSDDDGPRDFREANDQEIQDYIATNNLNAQMSNSGLYYVINEQGTGAQPSTTSNVTVAYKGYFTDGRVFDESSVSGVPFNLDEVIPGWTQGIPLFQEGGSGILLIPSHLAYGNSGIPGRIPGGAVLVFDVNLISVNQ